MHTSLHFLTAIVLALSFANLPLVVAAEIDSDVSSRNQSSAAQSTKDSSDVAGLLGHHSHKRGIRHLHKRSKAAKEKYDEPANIDIEMFSDKKCTESASTIWQKNNGVNYEQNYSAFHTSWTGDTIGSKEYVPFYSYRISRGLLGNEVLDFSDKGSEAESWCDIYSFTADSNAPADCYATAAFSCFSLRKAPDRKTPPLERKSETAKWDSGNAKLDITAYRKEGCPKNESDDEEYILCSDVTRDRVCKSNFFIHSVRFSREVYKGELEFSLDGTSESMAYTTKGSPAGCQEPAQLYNSIRSAQDRNLSATTRDYQDDLSRRGFEALTDGRSNAGEMVSARENAFRSVSNIVQRSGGDSGLDITAYCNKKGCENNDRHQGAYTIIRNLIYNVGTQIPTHSKNYQSLRISRDLKNNEYLVIDTDGSDTGTWWCWEEHQAGCCENSEGFTFNHVTLVLEREGRPPST